MEVLPKFLFFFFIFLALFSFDDYVLNPSCAQNTCFTIGCFSTSLCRSLRTLRTLFVHQTRAWWISYVRVSLSSFNN